MSKGSLTILVAEDDADDRLLLREAFAESRLVGELRFVEDGEELMDYLLRKGRYVEPASAPRPGIVLLDLNMPRMDGREALRDIKSDPDLRLIPIIVLTTSRAEDDILHIRNLGVNSFITKPVTYENLVRVIRDFGTVRLEIGELPE